MRIIEGFAKVEEALTRQTAERASDLDAKEKIVRKTIADVRKNGDKALFKYTKMFDDVELNRLEVSRAQMNRALKNIDKELKAALELAARRIAAYHAAQQKTLVRDSTNKKLGWLVRPLEKVGVYAPGFQAPLPSTVLMTAIPARVAGVKEIIMVTPPGRQGRVAPVMLAAAAIAGVDRVFSVGGAHAIAALAYGTESVPAVQKICGPGNVWVTLAKKLVYGDVGIDGLYGPSEVVIIADETANPAYCAADLLAQAEHGSGPTAILITTSCRLAGAVSREIESQLKKLKRRKVIEESLDSRGTIAVVGSVNEAIALANIYAPEHLCLVVADATSYVEKVKNVGCLFLGESSIEALVDYTAGPSHVLPTGGTARFGSGLNIMDFVKFISLVNLDKGDIKRLGRATRTIAVAEGLDAHAHAVAQRMENIDRKGKPGD
jgi:histidinol dehydrogenase